jgi:hypothetical protein
MSAQQLTLDLRPDLLRRYSTLREAIHHSALSFSGGLKGLAAECDLSVSELSRRLNPADGDPRSLDVNLFDRILEATDDKTPLQWLIAKHLGNNDVRKAHALDQLTRMLPEIAALLADAQAPTVAKGKR